MVEATDYSGCRRGNEFFGGRIDLCKYYLPKDQIVVPVINEFMDCCIFNHEQGLRVGDEILELDGERIYTNGDISMILDLNRRVEHDVVVLRDGEELTFTNLPMAHTHTDDKADAYIHYGFAFGEARQVGFGEKLRFAWNVVLNNIRGVRLSLLMLLRGDAGLQDLSGPVGIVQMMSEVANESDSSVIALQNMLSFGGMIAVNLAVMNLLPIPALDGGRVVGVLVTTFFEKITGKKPDPRYEGYLHGAGMILLLALMAFVMFKDIFVIFRG